MKVSRKEPLPIGSYFGTAMVLGVMGFLFTQTELYDVYSKNFFQSSSYSAQEEPKPKVTQNNLEKIASTQPSRLSDKGR